MLMVTVKNLRYDYTSASKKVKSVPGSGDFITRKRSELLCTFLHFSDNKIQDVYRGLEKLFKIFIISHLNSKFQTLHHPSSQMTHL
jgi:hypothetical protein